MVETSEADEEEPADPFAGLDERTRAMFEGMMAEPPVWLRWVHTLGMWLTVLILAVVFMVQWVFCMACGMHFFGTPGLVFGIALVATQICALFLTPDPKDSCSI